MERKSVGYIVDHPQRDLPGAILLARAFCSLNIDFYIIPMYEQGSDVPLLGLNAIIVNYARVANLDLIEGYHKAGLKVFVLDTEGGNQTLAGSNTPRRQAELLDELGYSKLLHGYFFWGKDLRDAFAEYCSMDDDRLVTVGCPRYDFAGKQWREVLKYPQKDFVLVNGNFPLVNPQFTKSRGDEISAMVAAGWDEGYVEELYDDMEKMFEQYLNALKRLAMDLPELKFVIRPHPFENRCVYTETFLGLANVDINCEGDVLNVMANASCLLHINCSTAVEALRLGKVPITLEYLNTDRLLQHAPMPSNISKHSKNYEDLLRLIKNVDTATAEFPFDKNYEKYVEPWYHLNDGNASVRVAEFISAEIGEYDRFESVRHSLSASRLSARPGQLFQSFLANVFGTEAVSKARAMVQKKRKQKRLNALEIQVQLDEITQFCGDSPITVSKAKHPLHGVTLSSIACKADINT